MLLLLLCASLTEAPAAQAQGPGTVLYDRFGVTLQLKAPYGGGTYNAFVRSSFAPTKNLATVDWVESDWHGNWNLTNLNCTAIAHNDPEPDSIPGAEAWRARTAWSAT